MTRTRLCAKKIETEGDLESRWEPTIYDPLLLPATAAYCLDDDALP